VQANFGMSPDQLERALKTYLNAGIRHAEVTIPGVEPEVAIARLPDSADDVLLLYVNLRDGASADEGAVLLTRARTLSARRPDDALTRVTLARAEILFGDPGAGEAALARDLEADPNDVERLLLMADARITAGDKFEDPAERERLYRQARGFLQRAYAADPNDHRVYQTIAHSRRFSPDYPTENDVELWRRAVAIAPQIASNRPVAAEALLKHGRFEEADAIIRPLASSPHGIEAPERLQRILDEIATQRTAASTQSPTT
jgi:tetratricopeptide (TPR) repeat protein